MLTNFCSFFLVILLFFCSCSSPLAVEMEETFIPVADYTDHEQVVRELQEKMDKMKIPPESPVATPPPQPAQPAVPTIFPRLPPEFAYLRDCGKGIFQLVSLLSYRLFNLLFKRELSIYESFVLDNCLMSSSEMNRPNQTRSY